MSTDEIREPRKPRRKGIPNMKNIIKFMPCTIIAALPIDMEALENDETASAALEAIAVGKDGIVSLAVVPCGNGELAALFIDLAGRTPETDRLLEPLMPLSEGIDPARREAFFRAMDGRHWAIVGV